MHTIVQAVQAELKNNIDEATRQSFQRFFKEEVECYGVKTATVNKIARKHWQEVKQLDKQEIFRLCEDLFTSGYTEDAFVACHWLPRLADRFVPADFATFRSWIENYIDNWAKCDSFCNHTMGDFTRKYPQYLEGLKDWTASSDR